mgnify:CR=1 FL=1
MDDKVRELLDRVRDTAVGAADAANQTARAAGKKAGQMVDVAKLNVQLFDLNGEFNDVLRQLGQVMYDTHRGQAEDGEQITALLDRADELSEKTAELKERIARLTRSQGEDKRLVGQAFQQYPLAFALSVADMEATYFLENEEAKPLG